MSLWPPTAPGQGERPAWASMPSARAVSSRATSSCSPRSPATATRCTTTRPPPRRRRFGEIIVQGGVTSGILNAVVAEDLPGPGTVFLNVDWDFTAPVRPGRRDHRRRRGARGARGQADHASCATTRPPRATGRRRSRAPRSATRWRSVAPDVAPGSSVARTAALTAAAMAAFAANSLLCRTALSGGTSTRRASRRFGSRRGRSCSCFWRDGVGPSRRRRAAPGARRWRSSPTRSPSRSPTCASPRASARWSSSPPCSSR